MSSTKERLVFVDTDRIPIHLISGFLGSGKTTLLQHLLNHCLTTGLKPAIMMNEYGEVNIDGELLRGQGFAVREMTNGCICCTIGGTLGLAIQEVVNLKPDVIFIEATGLADPIELIDQITKEEVLPLVRIASLISVLDPINFAYLAEELHSGIRQQTELADFVLINKSDLTDDSTLTAIAAQVRTLNPRTQVVITRYGKMNYQQILHATSEIAPSTSPHDQAPVHDHFHTLTILCEHPLDRSRFENLMRRLPPSIWRAKGFIRFTNSDEQWMFQSVLGEFAIEWIDLLPEPPEHIVFIGKDFDHDILREAVLACSAPKEIEKTQEKI